MSVREHLSFELVEGWEQLPDGWSHPDVPDVGIDAGDRVYVFGRGVHPVIVYEPDGSFVRAWGDGVFSKPHGLTVGPDGFVYCVDFGDHTVRKFTPEGELLLTLGTPDVPSDTGSEIDPRMVTTPAGPFNAPTKACVSTSGEIFVSDGYANCRIHVFAADGRLERSWGAPGDGPGEFMLPHSIALSPDEQRLFVVDRENSRIQIFDLEGGFIEEWTDFERPCGVAFDAHGRVYVAELGGRVGLWPWSPPVDRDTPFSRCTVLSPDGEALLSLGTDDDLAPGSFYAAHGIAVDSRGAVYVSEVSASAGGPEGAAAAGPSGRRTLQKFVVRQEDPGSAPRDSANT